MTDLTFVENSIYTNSKIYESVINHFNKISELHKNKKFEWEDEEVIENHNITFDFDEWFPHLKEYVENLYSSDEREVPENLDRDLIEYTNKIKEYVDGFVFAPTGMYEGKSFGVETYVSESVDGILNHMKELRENNKMIFLYCIFCKTKRPQKIVIEMFGSTRTLYEDHSISYKVRYGVIN